MNCRRLIISIFASLSLASCSVGPDLSPETPEEPGLVKVNFRVDSEGTRAYLGTPGASSTPLLWSESDHIAVFDGVAVRDFSVVPGSIQGSTAVFEGEMSGKASSVTAVYPLSGVTMRDGVLSAGVPSEQTASEGTADPAALVATASGTPGGELKFSNRCAVLRFSVGAGVKKVVFISDRPLASDGSRTLVVNLPGTEGTFAASVVSGDYTGFRAVSVSDSGALLKEGSKTLSVKDSQLCDLGRVDNGEKVAAIFTAGDLRSFLSGSTSSTSDKVLLLRNIDCSSVGGMDPAAGFAGTFDGLGHGISNLPGTLFSASSGTLRSFAVSGSVQVTPGVYAPVVLDNSGLVENVTSNVAVTMSSAAAVSESVVLGGIAAYSSGTVTNCTNAAALGYSCQGKTAGTVIGGIVAYNTGAVKGCANSAGISFSAYSYGSATQVGGVAAVSTSVGGIVGLGYTGGTISGCTNIGTISYSISAVDKIAETTKRNPVGGIAGNSTGNISDCRNIGDIEIVSRSSTGAAFGSYGAIICGGGICGADYFGSNQSDTSIKDCTNSGRINVHIDATSSNSAIGGIFGWPGKEAKELTSVTSGCTNSGDITAEGLGKGRFGGIQGGTGNIDGCTNTGNVTVNSSSSASVAGGVAAFHSQDHRLSNSRNTGNVVSKVSIAGVGGLIGNHGNVTLSCGEGCSVECSIRNVDSGRAGTGIVVGVYNGTSGVVTVGSVLKPVDVKGTIETDGQKTTITKFNYRKYLSGTGSSTSNHVIHAVCTTDGDPEGTSYAEGYVKWSDGTPAPGITVSDGFRNVVTDQNGHYLVETSTDTWYIYFSYPSNAKITRNSNGCPDFFKRYSKGTTRYDFTLTRQTVENEFMLVAMADPQAHYASRGSAQISADTDRFLLETVPTINDQISASSLPCYGVTLGDITYSEGTRNSNPGMTTMRSHYSKVNMPVFQSMGNHDYTFFRGSDNPLAADATSSTAQLKAQRKFEDTFGPVNLSFNRGDVHIICMRDIYWTSTTDAGTYHGGFTDEQYLWLKGDLENVPTDKKVIMCVHIPFVGLSGKENVSNVCDLLKKYTDSEIFSGHTHYKRGVKNVLSTGMYEHVHSAVCGQWWWSNIEGDGCPNGFTVYKVSGTKLVDEYFMGSNKGMNKREQQIRVYRGNIKTGGSYVYFKWPYSSNVILINVFNGDSRWQGVKVYENGKYTGTAALMSQKKENLTTEKGKTYTVSTGTSQDWWAIGWNMGVVGRGIGTSTSYQTTEYHMYKYTLKDATASVKVEATDPYGRVYTCTEVIENGTSYPVCVASGNH